MSESTQLALMLDRSAPYNSMLELFQNTLVNAVTLKFGQQILNGFSKCTHKVFDSITTSFEDNRRIIIGLFAFRLGINPF